MTPDERVARGQQAAHELRVTQAAFDGVKEDLLRRICETPPGDPARVLTLHQQVHALESVRKALQLVVSDGHYAAALTD